MADDDAFGAAFDDDIFLSEKVRNPIEPLEEQKAKYTAKQDDHGVSPVANRAISPAICKTHSAK
jgi:hypothetical protein